MTFALAYAGTFHFLANGLKKTGKNQVGAGFAGLAGCSGVKRRPAAGRQPRPARVASICAPAETQQKLPARTASISQYNFIIIFTAFQLREINNKRTTNVNNHI